MNDSENPDKEKIIDFRQAKEATERKRGVSETSIEKRRSRLEQSLRDFLVEAESRTAKLISEIDTSSAPGDVEKKYKDLFQSYISGLRESTAMYLGVLSQAQSEQDLQEGKEAVEEFTQSNRKLLDSNQTLWLEYKIKKV